MQVDLCSKKANGPHRTKVNNWRVFFIHPTVGVTVLGGKVYRCGTSYSMWHSRWPKRRFSPLVQVYERSVQGLFAENDLLLEIAMKLKLARLEDTNDSNVAGGELADYLLHSPPLGDH